MKDDHHEEHDDDTEEHEQQTTTEEAIVEEQARELAAATLRKVLPPFGNVTTEKALKQTLRSLGVVGASNDNTNNTKNKHAAETEHQQRRLRQLRQRVSSLVLGTSIFRLRHEYVYNVTILQQQQQQQVVREDGEHNNDDDDRDNKIRAMVDLHAAYLLEDESDNSNSGDNSDTDTNASTFTVPWPVHDPIQCLSLQYSMPEFLVRAWISEYEVTETRQLCRAANQPGPVTLRRNAYQCPSDDLLVSRLARDHNVTLVPMATNETTTSTIAEQVGEPNPVATLTGCLRLVSTSTPEHRPPSIWSMPAWKDGWFEVQDAGSQFIVASTEIVPGDTVVDYCAGNGGKTLAMLSHVAAAAARDTTAAAARNTTAHDIESSTAACLGQDVDNVHSQHPTTVIWAHDIVGARLAQLEGSLARVGVHPSIELRVTDHKDELKHGMADLVLVDAPCSSCGALRRRPSHRWTLQSDELTRHFPTTQLEILQQAARLVRPGGRLVYATCSISHWENEDVVGAWEKETENDNNLGWEPWEFSAPHQAGVAPHCRKLLPHRHDSDGFFVARWKRVVVVQKRNQELCCL
jgi:16S rRNA (cytosine967-C5)-methyltransferase